MSKNQKGHRKEQYYKKSKREGYRARSAFKLIDIQKRFNIFKRAFYILDLGSAPGSWLQVSKLFAENNLKRYKDQYYHRDQYKIMGIDVKNISPIENVNILNMDITTLEVQDEINSFFQDKLDLILSDASIKKSGNKFTDQLNQIKLCYKILDLTKFLKHKGVFVVKCFQGADFNNFFEMIKKKFHYVKSYKPKSSKKKSNEIYLIGFKKK
ncbi:MAG: SAM-dependent methyltransferase [Promethearchaeota archaeon]